MALIDHMNQTRKKGVPLPYKRIAYQVKIVRPNGVESFDLFRTAEAAQEFADDYLQRADTSEARETELSITGPFEI
jgi:hypothetical protein